MNAGRTLPACLVLIGLAIVGLGGCRPEGVFARNDGGMASGGATTAVVRALAFSQSPRRDRA